MSEKLSVLLVDDEQIVGKRLQPALEKAGYRVEVCQTGADALQRIEQEIFDIVVSDMRIDEVTGLQVQEAALRRSPRTKVIIITGYATMELAREATAKGAFDVIAKPFRPKDLRDAIARAVDQLRRATR